MTTPPSNLPFEPSATPAVPPIPPPPTPPMRMPPPPPMAPVAPPTPPMPAGEILTMPPRTEAKSLGKGGPEDIFSDLDQPKRAAGPSGAPAPSISQRGSPGAFVGIFVAVLAVIVIGGFAFWYFVIRAQAPVASDNLEPGAAPVSASSVTETPLPVSPTPIPTSVPTVEPFPAPLPSGTSNEPGPILPAPVTEPPLGTNIPLPIPNGTLPPETTPAASIPEPVPATTTPPVTVPDPDADKDGLSDKREIELGLDPQKADTDGDGLTDGEEVLKYGTNPRNVDTDGDTFPDGVETKKGYDPRGPSKCVNPDCSI